MSSPHGNSAPGAVHSWVGDNGKCTPFTWRLTGFWPSVNTRTVKGLRHGDPRSGARGGGSEGPLITDTKANLCVGGIAYHQEHIMLSGTETPNIGSIYCVMRKSASLVTQSETIYTESLIGCDWATP
eukprot:1183798-Prorocentrum_minimum.AAC.2